MAFRVRPGCCTTLYSYDAPHINAINLPASLTAGTAVKTALVSAAGAFDVDLTAAYIFYADTSNGISRANLDGSSPTQIALLTALGAPAAGANSSNPAYGSIATNTTVKVQDIRVDTINDNVYVAWIAETDATISGSFQTVGIQSAVVRMDYNGAGQSTLLSGANTGSASAGSPLTLTTGALALDPAAGVLFWSQQTEPTGPTGTPPGIYYGGTSFTINRGDLSAGSPSAIISLTLPFATGTLYNWSPWNADIDATISNLFVSSNNGGGAGGSDIVTAYDYAGTSLATIDTCTYATAIAASPTKQLWVYSINGGGGLIVKNYAGTVLGSFTGAAGYPTRLGR